LISPSSENEEEKFELAHERMIPALRRLAGKQLSDANRADQLLDRRTNEWLGNGRHSRYLLSWSETRLINKHKRFITWGKERQAKEELLAASQRRFRLRSAAVVAAILLAVMGWIGWDSNTWQTYLIKRDLRSDGYNLNDNAVLTEIAQAFVYAGDSQFSLLVVKRISDDDSKANALRAIAASIAELAESSNDRTLYDKTFGFIEGFGDDRSKDRILDVILSSKLSVADVNKLRSLTTHYGVGGPGKARALARILMACSHPELIGKKEEANDDNDR